MTPEQRGRKIYEQHMRGIEKRAFLELIEWLQRNDALAAQSLVHTFWKERTGAELS
jgi:hypothetical protein